MSYTSIQLTFAWSVFFLIVIVGLSVGLSAWLYRETIPPVSQVRRRILIRATGACGIARSQFRREGRHVHQHRAARATCARGVAGSRRRAARSGHHLRPRTTPQPRGCKKFFGCDSPRLGLELRRCRRRVGRDRGSDSLPGWNQPRAA